MHELIDGDGMAQTIGDDKIRFVFGGLQFIECGDAIIEGFYLVTGHLQNDRVQFRDLRLIVHRVNGGYFHKECKTRYRSSGEIDLIASAKRLCAAGITGRCFTTLLGGYAPRQLPPLKSFFGRKGRG
jgi:hypothetical protein